METELCHIYIDDDGTITINQMQSLFLSEGYIFLANAMLDIILHDASFNMKEPAPFIKRFIVFYDISSRANVLRITHQLRGDMLKDVAIHDFGIFTNGSMLQFPSFFHDLTCQQQALILSILLGTCMSEKEARCIELVANELYFDVARRADALISRGLNS